FGAEQSLGAVVGLSLIRELGPVLTALLATGRAGSATTAEIGTMVATEQLDVRTLAPTVLLVCTLSGAAAAADGPRAVVEAITGAALDVLGKELLRRGQAAAARDDRLCPRRLRHRVAPRAGAELESALPCPAGRLRHAVQGAPLDDLRAEHRELQERTGRDLGRPRGGPRRLDREDEDPPGRRCQ